MRIGIVLLSIRIGGTEKRLARLYQFLARRSQHRYYLVATDRIVRLLKQQQVLTDEGLELYSIDCGPWQGMVERLRWPYYSAFPMWRRALNEALHRANAVSATDVFHYGIPISYFHASQAFRSRSVIEAMASTHEWHIELMLRSAARRGTIVNCLSWPIHQSLAKRLPPDAARRLHVSPGSLLEFGPDIPAGSKQPRVVFVGRLETVKNPLLFVEAVARLRKRTQKFRASILGDGRLAHRVDARIQELGLNDFLDRSFHHSPRQLLSEASIFVSLQAMDNYPSQALLEAMASGCATVASDVGTTSRLVTPETGVLVPFDADAVADAIFSLLADPARAQRMGQAARELVRREHSIEKYADYVESLYRLAAGSDASASIPWVAASV